MKSFIFKPWKAEWIARLKPGELFMTRRPLKPQPKQIGDACWKWKDRESLIGYLNFACDVAKTNSMYPHEDVVYVKEVWRAHVSYNLYSPSKLPHDVRIFFEDHTISGRKRSPLFLPARFARSFFKVVEVGVGRVQDISQKDCYLEGVKPIYHYLQYIFSMAWDELYICQPDLQWSANPWVWVYTLEKLP